MKCSKCGAETDELYDYNEVIKDVCLFCCMSLEAEECLPWN